MLSVLLIIGIVLKWHQCEIRQTTNRVAKINLKVPVCCTRGICRSDIDLILLDMFLVSKEITLLNDN